MPKEGSSYLSWLVGKNLTAVKNRQLGWVFSLGPNLSITTESYWRLLSSERIEVTSDDEGKQYGLPAPINAAERVCTLVNTKKIQRYSIAEISSDLTLFFDDGIQLQFLNLSSGYESWQASNGTIEVICQGGGNLVVF